MNCISSQVHVFSFSCTTDKLYFVSLRAQPRDTATEHFFSIDNDLVYLPFFADFGPLNLGCSIRFCRLLDSKLNAPENANRKIYFFSSYDGAKRSNAALLIAIWMVLRQNKSPEDAFRPYNGIYPPFIPFRDASYGISTFNLTILDCLRGIAKAQSIGWLNLDTFDLDEYEFYEKLENGDLNRILPGKFVAFSGPQASHTPTYGGIILHTPEDYIPLFKKWNITAVIRLNKKIYDKRRFTENGISHHDLYFVDGGCPSDAITRQFLEITENERGVVAVHCKAGLGRTGTLIACYAMKHFGFTASEFIGYIRICRPGSIIGPQQHFLKDMEARLWKAGELHRRKIQSSETLVPVGVGPAKIVEQDEKDGITPSKYERQVGLQGPGARPPPPVAASSSSSSSRGLSQTLPAGSLDAAFLSASPPSSQSRQPAYMRSRPAGSSSGPSPLGAAPVASSSNPSFSASHNRSRSVGASSLSSSLTSASMSSATSAFKPAAPSNPPARSPYAMNSLSRSLASSSSSVGSSSSAKSNPMAPSSALTSKPSNLTRRVF